MELFNLLEWAATVVECLLIFNTIAAVAGRRYQGARHYFVLILSTLCLTVLISIMNHISAFSFFTPVVATAFTLLVLSPIFSSGTLLLRSTACVMTEFIIITTGYNLQCSVGPALWLVGGRVFDSNLAWNTQSGVYHSR